jgi:4-hydroxy-2-oxoheptanedioate aldolase
MVVSMTLPPAPSGPLDHGRLRARLAAGERTVGTFVGMASPIAAEGCAAAGVDWLLLDLVHGAGGEENVPATVPTAAAYGVPTVVRAESDARIGVGRILDGGAAGGCSRGSTTPSRRGRPSGISTTRRAVTGESRPTTAPAASVSARRRWTGPTTRWHRADRVAQTVTAAEEIAAIEGVDVLFVGPRDLSHDLGVPGQTTAPQFLEALCRSATPPTSTGSPAAWPVPDDAAAAAGWLKAGASWPSARIPRCWAAP